MLVLLWLRQLQSRWFPRRAIRRAPVRRVRPCLEVLEDRLTPSGLPTVTYTVTDASDNAGNATDVTLRYAINQAVANASSQDTVINFSNMLAGQTITLSNPNTSVTTYGPTEFVINNNANITIDGAGAPGLVIRGSALRPFAVTSGASLTLEDRQSLLAEPDTTSRLKAERALLRREAALLGQVRAVPVARSDLAVPSSPN